MPNVLDVRAVFFWHHAPGILVLLSVPTKNGEYVLNAPVRSELPKEEPLGDLVMGWQHPASRLLRGSNRQVVCKRACDG